MMHLSAANGVPSLSEHGHPGVSGHYISVIIVVLIATGETKAESGKNDES
jgi:hypothetical protein